ncbi:LOW QUALITY PROTEIN: dynein regulatory complex subunit 4-like [Uloborus diversus]|uniref:LOW QUALITY PROTEIN: dynein regulatory complex subunit 4-like n=1 Tax=Uloborus diversus TaxID=327109 RepID=UPI0024095D36|nr:LOW QUALITY PROTEIN: dynein regulatory complex subunit 4-like [Uloborus diversus]
MDAKKKAPTKKGSKKQFRNYAVLGGVSVAEMSREQLEEHINQLQQEIEREKEDRNYFQMERDRIQLFWEVTKQQLEEKDALLRLKDSEIDEAALTHLAEIKLYKQKMKHVMFECQQHIDEKMKEKMGEKIMAEEEHELKIHHLGNEINKLNDEIMKLKIDHSDETINQRLKHAEELCALHQKYHTEMDIAKSKGVQEIQSIRNDLELQKTKVIQEIEDGKDAHVQHLIQTHEELFKRMKNFYNDIINNDILLIKSLKDQIQNFERKQHYLKEKIQKFGKEITI